MLPKFVKHVGLFIGGIGVLSIAVPVYTYTLLYVYNKLEKHFPINKKE